MNIFDLLFICLFLASVATAGIALVLALRGKTSRAGTLLRWWACCAATYMAAVIAVSVVLPRRTLHLREPHCFDDWCIAVEECERIAGANGNRYSVTLNLSSRALRVAQRENNLAVYITDDRGHRYDPVPRVADAPFNVLLAPSESRQVGRIFQVPPDARGLGVVVSHEGGFPIGWFIIGYDTWFRKPPIVPIPS